ncbi:MAG: fluoride efflux transporter CrcB [Betaproteobacteria bacterium]|nr:fluoride efflux transporter CrcB [Betaproteobacteria bacterium]
MWKPVLVISLGAALGALLRWQLGVRLNALLPGMPPGTLVANIVGGYIVGLAAAYFLQVPELSPQWRLFVITGFCGGLTTFSTFSAEVISLLQEGRTVWALGTIATHLGGSLLSTLAGLSTWQLLKAA